MKMFELGKENHMLIPGAVGQLECLISCPKNPVEQEIVILCHPHPLHGGTMRNKVITTLAKMFHVMGICSVRFNYRGVGKSEGEYGHAEGEIEDCCAVMRWVESQFPHKTIHFTLAGFSFGAYIVYRVASSRQNVKRVICVAPAVNHADFDKVTRPSAPLIIVYSDQDEIVPGDAVREWIQTLEPPPTVLHFTDASHFFHGKLIALREQLKKKLAESY